jgi:Na+/melibiose symporter-like transporter
MESAASSMLGIRMTAAVYPAICTALAVAVLLRYPITKELNDRIGRELAERRARYSSSPATENATAPLAEPRIVE